MTLKDFGNIPFRLSALEAVYPEIRDIRVKAARLEDSGEIIRLKRGFYVVNPKVSGVRLNDFLIANHLYGPSYVSMQSALRYYGLIPETVYEVQSLATGLAKSFTNSLGTFRYIHCPSEYYSIGVTSVMEQNISFMIASPEKALCDLIMFTPKLNLRYTNEIRAYLDEDIRIDMEELAKFDIDILKECASAGRKKPMIDKLIKIIQYERNV